jgi:hypothetical protein
VNELLLLRPVEIQDGGYCGYYRHVNCIKMAYNRQVQ